MILSTRSPWWNIRQVVELVRPKIQWNGGKILWSFGNKIAMDPSCCCGSTPNCDCPTTATVTFAGVVTCLGCFTKPFPSNDVKVKAGFTFGTYSLSGGSGPGPGLCCQSQAPYPDCVDSFDSSDGTCTTFEQNFPLIIQLVRETIAGIDGFNLLAEAGTGRGRLGFDGFIACTDFKRDGTANILTNGIIAGNACPGTYTALDGTFVFFTWASGGTATITI